MAWLSQFSVVNVLALTALVSLAIPLIIHLFNRSRGRLVKFSHIELVKMARQQSVSELKLSQWLLLFLRLVMLILLALILAQLQWQKQSFAAGTIAVVTPAWLAQSETEQIDSSLNQIDADSVFVLGSGLQPYEAGYVQDASERPNWPLFYNKVAEAGNQAKVHVFGVNTHQEFGLYTPKSLPQVQWHLTASKSANADNTPSLSVLLAGNFTPDERLVLQNAIKVINAYRQLDVHLSEMRLSEWRDAQHAFDWVIAKASVAQIADIQIQRPGESLLLVDVVESVPVELKVKLAAFPFNQFSVDRLTPYQLDSMDSSILWQAENGLPVLILRESAGQDFLHLLTGLTPPNTDLGLQDEFPTLLLSLLTQQRRDAMRFAQAPIVLGQSSETEFSNTLSPKPVGESMHQWLAVLLLLVWGLERIVSEQRAKNRE